jgi:glutamate 5-kinase
MSNHETLVAKYGSSCLVNEHGLDQVRIDDYAERLSDLHQYRLVVVSSGAVAVGRQLWHTHHRSADASSQVLATLGSAGIAEAWRTAFAKQNILTGQILVTHREIDDQQEGASLQQALSANADHGVVSIVNENDALSDLELKKLSYGGDNDGLAVRIAHVMKASRLLLLTGVDGFKRNDVVQGTVRVHELQDLEPHLYEASTTGTGSMKSKLEAASQAALFTDVTIANAEANYQDILDHKTGTQVVQ